MLLNLFIWKLETDIGNKNNYELISLIHAMHKMLRKMLVVKFEFPLPNHIPVKLRDAETKCSKQLLENPSLSNILY